MKFENIGLAVKEARENKGLTQDQLSKALGYDNGQFISNVERGKCSIPVKKLKKMARKTNVSAEHFVNFMVLDYQQKLLKACK